MKRTALMTVMVAAVLVSCSSDENPVGVPGVRYWDIAWSSPDTILTDIEMLGEKSGWACGYRYNGATSTYDGLIFRYDGTTWDVALFLPGEMGARLTAIDFVGEKNGWALGNREGEFVQGPLVLHYDGEQWSEAPVEGLNGGMLKLLAVVGDNDVWVSDGITAFHYDGGWWTPFPLASGAPVDHWVFPAPNVGWAVSYESGYCFKWDGVTGGWMLEPHPLYDATTFYFNGDGSGVYADYVNIPPVTERTNIYVRAAGPAPSYKRIYATTQSRWLTACDFFPPDYYFFAGPNAAFVVVKDNVEPLGYVPSGELGVVRALSVAARGDVWGVMGRSLQEGPSFIVHKKG
jgi:hypothetical protein